MKLEYSEFHLCESFESIHGEGSFVGAPALFIRLSGCDKACKFCDEPAHRFKDKIEKSGSAEEIFRHVHTKHRNFFCWSPLVVITGGEPTLYDLDPLIEEMRAWANARVSVESNGYNPAAASRAHLYTYSPKGADLETERFASLIQAACRDGWLFKRTLAKTYTDIKLLFKKGDEKETLEKLRVLQRELSKMSEIFVSVERPRSYVDVYLSAINEVDTINNENNQALVSFMFTPEFQEACEGASRVKMSAQLHKFLSIK